jgi:protein-disulfide isomerase
MEAAEASFAAKAQGKFWEMHDKMFANQQKLDRADLDGYAKDLGLDMARYKSDMDSHKYKDQIDADSKAGTGYGASGTPTAFINGRKLVGAQPMTAFEPIIQDEIKHADELLAKGTPRDKLYEKILETVKTAPAPSAAAAPTPSHVDIQPGDSPSKGPKNAPVTLIIFSDFQCPFCSRVEPTLKQVEQSYGDKVRIVWKHKPLPMHPNAKPAAEAAEAAREQGKFWQMHDKMFAAQGELSPASYEKWARELGLDVARFKASIASGRNTARIDADDGQASAIGINGTPTMVVNGEKVVGAVPFENLKAVIDRQLAAKR